MDLKSEILYRYPFPISVTYLNADNAREAVAAHDQRLRLFEVTLKFLSSIAIAQYLHDRLEDSRVRQALRGLARPSLGQWNGFMREILNAYRRADRVEEMFISELYDAYNARRTDRPAMAAAHNAIVNYVQGRTDSAVKSVSVRQLCDAMVNYRNKTVGHGAITRYHCEQMNDPLFEALEEMLGQLSFLREHRLVYVEDVRVRRGSYAHEMMSYMGSTPPARMKEAYVADRPEEYRVEEQLYLCARGENVPVLSLHPLVIAWQGDVLFLNESERERGIEYLSYQSGQIKKPDRLLEDFREILGFVLGDEAPRASLERIREQVTPLSAEPLDPYEEGQQALKEQAWAVAVAAFARVGRDHGRYADAQAGLAEAERQQAWLDRYREGQRLIGDSRWSEAQQVLGELISDAGEYRDVQALLGAIRAAQAREESLQELYGRATDALEAGQWERAYELLNRVHELRPDFGEVGVLLTQQRRLHDLYDQAIEAVGERRWAEAQATLRQLEALEPSYKDLASLLQRAERGLENAAQLSSWYDKAKSHIALEAWDEALQLLDQIHDRDATYRDVVDMIAQVQSMIRIPCPRCGVMTPAGYKFCGRCGSPIQSWICWRCESPVPVGRQFCGKCGAPRDRPALTTCSRCGHENPQGRTFCGGCGQVLG